LIREPDYTILVHFQYNTATLSLNLAATSSFYIFCFKHLDFARSVGQDFNLNGYTPLCLGTSTFGIFDAFADDILNAKSQQ